MTKKQVSISKLIRSILWTVVVTVKGHVYHNLRNNYKNLKYICKFNYNFKAIANFYFSNK